MCAENVEKTLFTCEDCSAWFEDKKSYDQHICVGHPSSSKSQLDQDEGNYTQQGNGIAWTRPPTLLLIDEYAKYIHKCESGLMRKKDMWNQIQLKLKNEGYTFSVDQIAGRWKSLMRGYKNIKDHNQKSGNDAKKHEYQDELDDLFRNDPVVLPVLTRTSGKRSAKEVDVPVPSPTCSTSSTSTMDMDKDTCLNKDDSFDEPANEAANKKCKRSTGSAKEMVTLMKTFMEDRKKKEEEEVQRKEQMHRERIAVMNNLIAAITGKSRPTSRNDND